MQKLIVTVSLAVSVFSLTACNQAGGGGARPAITSEDDKTFYALGLMLGRNVGSFNRPR